MKIGILVSMINNFGEKGFYNSQEIGLAKMLSSKGHEVTVYKLLSKKTLLPKDVTCANLKVYYKNVFSLGINGIVSIGILDKELDALIYFSDTQISVPRVYKWCRRNGVKFIPYIGVIESHSPNRIKKAIMDFSFSRNISVFKKSICLVKNNDVKNRLAKRCVHDIRLAPVGIDLDLLNKNYSNIPVETIKKEFGYNVNDKVLLFIGRLEEEKRPIDLVHIFDKLHKLNPNYKLLIVGKGALHQELIKEIQYSNLEDSVQYIEKIPNSEIWKLYRLSYAFLNLNKQEIFGICNNNNKKDTWEDTTLRRVERIRRKESIKGAPTKQWFYFLKKNFSLSLTIKGVITPFIRILLGK